MSSTGVNDIAIDTIKDADNAQCDIAATSVTMTSGNSSTVDKTPDMIVRDTSSRYTLCLTMIVKNESKIIKRLLDSVATIVDFVCITDTGSTDNTVEIIEQWGKDHQIPTTVPTSEFRSFGYARNRSLENSHKLYPKADFLLLLDGDFVVELNGFTKSELNLKHHMYNVKQYDAWKSWGNIRIVANWVSWEYHLRTHEYITSCAIQKTYSGEIRSQTINTLRINDKGDGGSKSDKFERDQRLLQEDIDDPELSDHDRTRCYYYQGNSYKNGGKPKEAIPFYKKRIACQGWYEEVYLSWCNIGGCYEELYNSVNKAIEILERRKTETPDSQLITDIMSEYLTSELVSTLTVGSQVDHNTRIADETFLVEHGYSGMSLDDLKQQRDEYFKQAIQNYIQAYSFCKIRAESLYAVVKMLRTRSDKDKDDLSKGLFLALEGAKIPIPTQCTLEVQDGIHRYGFDSEIMILAYYVPNQLHHGQAAKDRLASKVDQMSSTYRHMYEYNKRFYK